MQNLNFTGTRINYYFVCRRKLWLFSKGAKQVTPVPRSKPEDLNETLLVEYFRRFRDIGYDDKSK